MRISLKWKSVFYLSVILVIITCAWIWQSVEGQKESFRLQLVKEQKNNSRLMVELIDENTLKLAQFSHLIVNKKIILDGLSGTKPSQSLDQGLLEDQLDYSIDLDLDYLAIYDKNVNFIGGMSSNDLEKDYQFIHESIRELKIATVAGVPRNYIYCRNACYLVNMEPFITDEGDNGVIVLAQNIVDITRLFFELTGSVIGILVDPGEDAGAKKVLSSWGVEVWALSDFANAFPVLDNLSNMYPLEYFSVPRSVVVGQSMYGFQVLPKHRVNVFGKNLTLVSLVDNTESYQSMMNNVKSGVITGLVGLVISECLLLMLVRGPMLRLGHITQAIKLLPKRKFEQAVNEIDIKPVLVTDEIYDLETGTVLMAKQLDGLYKELDLKNNFLKEQIYALTRSRSFLTRLFNSAELFIITHNFNFEIQSSNEKFINVFGSDVKSFEHFIRNNEDRDDFFSDIELLKKGSVDHFSQEFDLSGQDGKFMVVTWTHTLVENEEGETVILSVGMDQTKQKKAENDLRWMANHDGLTAVGNRRWFNVCFRNMLKNNENGVLVFIDVNRFKQINDIYGHTVGDEVLLDLTQRLKGAVRGSDIVSRYAGDEFTILLPGMTAHDLPAMLTNLSRELRGTVKANSGQMTQYTVSIGASVFPNHGVDSQTLIQHADMAMYHAKNKGFGHWHIFDESDERVAQMRSENVLMLSIKNALKNDTFSLVYQPILDIKNNKVTHFEVLIRMLNEDGENISPGLFIPVAEKTGDIRLIDEWVLEHALQDLKKINYNSDIEVTFSVNISAPTLQSDDFHEFIFAAIERHGIEPESLMIELTETAYVENFQQVLKNLKKISKRGVKVALDDFGVGFSSFNYLKLLPLNYVKLDGSYIKNLTKNADDQVFVKSMSAMIEAFGMKTVAEFVEDQDTVTLLDELGVTHGQGYFIGKPAPFSSICPITGQVVA